MAVTDAALRAVAANATRHLLEADQHYKARRYPSATASAVLSIEESGKLAFLASTGSMPKAKGRARHAMHAALFVALAKLFAADSAWVADWRKMLRDGNTSGLTTAPGFDSYYAAHHERTNARRAREGLPPEVLHPPTPIGLPLIPVE
jgi:AbiV family abortive infection protein